jgi:signal transduction histidine kinase
MDDITTPPGASQTVATNDLSTELAHVTQEMYKKSLELAEKNKTLSLLREIDEIILGSVTDTRVVAQKMVDAVVSEGGLKDAVIYLVDRNRTSLMRIAQAQNERILRAEAEFNKKYYSETIPLSQINNFAVTSVTDRQLKNTSKLYDILISHLTETESAKIQDILGISKILIYPLIVRNEVLGVMIVGTDEQDKVLSEYRTDLINRLAATVGIAIDNSLLYLNIQLANERLKELDKMKDEFVSLASHELRTPMTAVKSYLSMIKDNHMIQDPKGSEYVDHAYEVTDRLISLVNDMLNVSRIESGRMVLTLAPVQLGKIIQEVVAEVMPVAQKQGITLQAAIDDTLIPEVQADENKLKEVFMNLIGNSLKFTPAGGAITLSAKTEGNLIMVMVRDSGKGIRPEDLPKLFTKFGMIEKNYAPGQSSKGTGLGLYICKSIVELHGGKISVSSEGENMGTTFSFSLKPTETNQP